jgi:hypothetical protein
MDVAHGRGAGLGDRRGPDRGDVDQERVGIGGGDRLLQVGHLVAGPLGEDGQHAGQPFLGGAGLPVVQWRGLDGLGDGVGVQAHRREGGDLRGQRADMDLMAPGT